jgi:7-cyano-7-deazaguanine synthase
MEDKPVILLLSGGIDSTTLLAKLVSDGRKIIALSFSYGQKHSIELEFAKLNAEKYYVEVHKIIKLDSQLFERSALVNQSIDISTYQNYDLPVGKVNAYVPFRNLVFISTALSLAETLNINEVYVAINKDDSQNFWDCKLTFVEQINTISGFSKPIRVITPFINLSKKDVIKLSKQLGVNINETITCYQPDGRTECGVCLSCRTKQNALGT